VPSIPQRRWKSHGKILARIKITNVCNTHQLPRHDQKLLKDAFAAEEDTYGQKANL
jgi:hypothetical protein